MNRRILMARFSSIKFAGQIGVELSRRSAVTRFVFVGMALLVGLLPPATAVALPKEPSPVGAWFQRLRSDDTKIRAAAAYGLDLPAECPPAERALLLQALKDPNAFTRRYTTAALGEVRPPTEEVTKALIAALSDNDTDVREQAAVSLSKIGASAIPLLFDRLRKLPAGAYSKPHGEATGIAFALSNNGDATLKPLIGFVKEQPTILRETKRKPPVSSEEGFEPEFNSEPEACAALLLGEIGMPAVPALASLLRDRKSEDFAVHTLLRIEPINVLARNWNAPEAEMRELSRRLIINSDGAVAGLLDALSKELSQKNTALRLAAVKMIREIGRSERFPNATMQALGQALSDSDQAVRGEAAASLAELIPANKVPDSVKKQASDALERADKPMRSSLVEILAATGSREALPEIIKCIHDPECRSRGLAEALANLAPDAPGVVEALVTALADEGWDEPAAVQALEAFGAASKSVVAGLTKVLLRDAPFSEVADVIAHTGKDGITALIALVNDAGAPSAAKQDAAAALARVAGENRSIGEALKSFLSHPEWELRISAAQALANAGDVETVRSFLRERMKGKAPEAWSETMELLKLQVRIDPEAAAARLKPESADVSDIASAIEKTGTTNEKFVGPLLAQLSNKDMSARRDAATALGQFGLFRDRIVPRLLEKLNDPSEFVRDHCFEALATLVTDPAKFDPLFRKLTNDKLVNSSLSIFFSDLQQAIHPGPLPSAAGLGELPPFPWPPPRYSSIGTFGRDFDRKLIGDDDTTLGTVYQRLYDALTLCDSNFESGLFRTPGGFALLSKMERIAQDGTPFAGKQRWVLGKIPPQSLSDLLTQLFLEKPGFFRVIAFVVTDQINFEQGNEELPDFHRGGTVLPPGIASLTMKGRQCYALVYSFEKRAGSSATNLSHESLNAKLHLAKAGLLDALSARR
jgi:HEAT repeat protein